MAGIGRYTVLFLPLVLLAACSSINQEGGSGNLKYSVIKSAAVSLTAAELQVSPSSGLKTSVDLLTGLTSGNSVSGIVSCGAGVAKIRAGFMSAGREALKTFNIKIDNNTQSELEVLLTGADFTPVEKLWIFGSAVPGGSDPAAAVELTQAGTLFSWAGNLETGSFRILVGEKPLNTETSSAFMPPSNGITPDGDDQPMTYSPGTIGRSDNRWSIVQPSYYRIVVNPETMTIKIQAAGPQSANGKAPMYWTVYEYCREREYAGVDANLIYVPEDIFKQNIDWVADNLLPYGFDMVCTDGWGGGGYIPTNINGYRAKHSAQWVNDYAWWSNYLRQKGMSLGVYWNPLWIDLQAALDGKKVWNTDIPIADIYDPDEWSIAGFKWVDVEKPGAEQYIKGCVKYYADMGVTFLRVDFLSWYETGTDRSQGIVGKTDRPRADYEQSLRWMREACDEYGVYLSLVMPNLKNDAEYEKVYGDMYRIDGDTLEGGWERLSAVDRGERRVDIWSQFENPFDGFTWWSQFVEEGMAIMDGDFLRLNTFANDEERRTAVSIMVMAGGPIAVADRIDSAKLTPYNGNDMLPFYQNDELMALVREGFRGKPLTHDYSIANSANQIWTGQAANGDWIVGLFNREDSAQTRTIDFPSILGISSGRVRNIWNHSDEGVQNALSISVPPHGCKIYRISAEN